MSLIAWTHLRFAVVDEAPDWLTPTRRELIADDADLDPEELHELLRRELERRERRLGPIYPRPSVQRRFGCAYKEAYNGLDRMGVQPWSYPVSVDSVNRSGSTPE